jgi:hypothetical protein
MLKHRSSIIRPRWLGAAASLTMLAAFAAEGCGSDDKGTDIIVPAGGSNAGSAGKSSSAGSNSKAGNGAAGSASQEGGASGLETTGGESGSGASTNGGTAGTGGGSGGTAGSAGTAGTGGGAGTGGASGSAGTAGAGGMAGSAGAGGKGGSGGTAGSGGSGGTAGSGGTGGSGGAGTVCGDGKVEGAEECDNGVDGTPWKGDRICADDCETVSTQACVDCEQAGDCFASSDNCAGPSGSPFSDVNIGLCYDVFQCFQAAHCMDGAGSLGKCYCGDLSTAACSAAPFDLRQQGAPNGPCAEIMQMGSPGVTSNSVLLGGLTNKSRPSGAAGQRMNCAKLNCAEACGIVTPP